MAKYEKIIKIVIEKKSPKRIPSEVRYEVRGVPGLSRDELLLLKDAVDTELKYSE